MVQYASHRHQWSDGARWPSLPRRRSWYQLVECRLDDARVGATLATERLDELEAAAAWCADDARDAELAAREIDEAQWVEPIALGLLKSLSVTAGPLTDHDLDMLAALGVSAPRT